MTKPMTKTEHLERPFKRTDGVHHHHLDHPVVRLPLRLNASLLFHYMPRMSTCFQLIVAFFRLADGVPSFPSKGIGMLDDKAGAPETCRRAFVRSRVEVADCMSSFPPDAT